MTRETKIGMVVAVSFLCLVGIVVATKWRRGADGASEVAQHGDSKGKGAAAPHEPNGSNPPPKKGPVTAAEYTEVNPPPATNNDQSNPPPPVVVPMNNDPPVLPPAPAVPMVNLPMVNVPEAPPPMDEAARQALLNQIKKDNENKLILPPPPAPLPSNVFNKPPDAAVNPPANVNDNKNNVFGPANNQALPTVAKGNDDGFRPLPKVEDVAVKPNEAANKAIQGASEKFDALLNKANDASMKGIDNVNKGLDNVSKNVTAPPPVPNPAVPALPTFPAADNKNDNPLAKVEGALPAIPAPMNQNLPPITNNNSNNPLTKVEGALPAIPAPMGQNLPPTTDNNNVNNSGFVIPAPGNASNVKVTNYDAQSFVARQGDTFASLGREKYGAESYGNALLAFNRDYNREFNPNSTTLLPGQKVMLPSRQFLRDRYATAVADNRPGLSAGGGITIKQPVPVIPKSNVPAPPTSDVTKSYRVPAAGQPIYELAIQTLGDGGRWTEIYRLNPNIDPLRPIPGGTVVRLPVNARTP